jgi:tetratricopeptide (TPR) repeat protein
MSNSALALHGFDEAKKLQLEAVDLIERIYGEASIEFLDAHYRYAEWLRSRREFVEAERTYYSVQRMIRRDFDDDPVQRIRLLLIRAQNQREFNTTWGYRGQAGMAPGLSGSQPEDLEQALEIARELDEPDPVLEARILRDTGDWYVAQMDFDRIAEPYEQAWQLLDDVEGGAGLQLEWFAEQTMLYAAPMYSPYVVVDPAAPSGRVEIEFTIDAHGLTRNVEIVEVEPQGLLEEAAIRQIGSSRFRPRIEDGAVVSSTGSFTWVFQYDAERARRFGSSFSLNN